MLGVEGYITVSFFSSILFYCIIYSRLKKRPFYFHKQGIVKKLVLALISLCLGGIWPVSLAILIGLSFYLAISWR